MEFKIIFSLAGFPEKYSFQNIIAFPEGNIGMFFRTVCFDEVVFIMTDCFLLLLNY